MKSCLAYCFFQPAFFNNGDEALHRVISEPFDVLLVDSLHQEASRICRSVYSSIRPPVALWVNGGDSNWSEFGGWDVDGFIADSASQKELLARLRAIARRPVKRLTSISI